MRDRDRRCSPCRRRKSGSRAGREGGAEDGVRSGSRVHGGGGDIDGGACVIDGRGGAMSWAEVRAGCGEEDTHGACRMRGGRRARWRASRRRGRGGAASRAGAW
jgi:hypothetical protein